MDEITKSTILRELKPLPSQKVGDSFGVSAKVYEAIGASARLKIQAEPSLTADMCMNLLSLSN